MLRQQQNLIVFLHLKQEKLKLDNLKLTKGKLNDFFFFSITFKKIPARLIIQAYCIKDWNCSALTNNPRVFNISPEPDFTK